MAHLSVAPLRNVKRLTSMIDQVQNRAYGLPGMACFYGFSGFGKSTAATYAANFYDAYYIQMRSCWTAKKFCSVLLEEMGIEPQRTIADQLDQIAAELAASARPILVDEADFLVQKRTIEILRDIYESTNTAVILIGEERLPQKLQQWERLHGRMLAWVAAEPACLADIAPLAEIYAPKIAFSEGLRRRILEQSNGSLRRVCTTLAQMREIAGLKNVSLLDEKIVAQDSFAPKHAPAPRRMVG